MRNRIVILTTIFIFLNSCVSEKQNTKFFDYLSKELDAPSTYEPVSLDTISILEIFELNDELRGQYNNLINSISRFQILIENPLKWINPDTITRMINYVENYPIDYSIDIETAAQLEGVKSRIDIDWMGFSIQARKYDIVFNRDQLFIHHTFRANNSTGNPELHKAIFILDVQSDSIVSMINIDR